jgi:hypothetical protein
MSGHQVLRVEFEVLMGVLVGVFLFAMWKGDLPERIGATANLGAGLVATAFVATSLQHILSPDTQSILLLAVDAALAACFLYLALRYASLWVGAALLFQSVQFSLHAYYLVMGAHHDFNYKIINNLDTSGINLALLLGTALAWRRRSKEAATVAPSTVAP